MSEIIQNHAVEIFVNAREEKTAELCIPIRPERRRTPRNNVPVPLFVYGHTAEGRPFHERTFTSAVNVHGGAMRMETSVQLGQRLLVTNQKNDFAQPCVVVFVGARLGSSVEVAFSFTAAMPSFWQESGIRRASGRALELEGRALELLKQ